MAEQHFSEDSLAIDASGVLRDIATYREIELIPHMDNLQAMAASIGAPAVDNGTRILLLGPGQHPHTDEYTLMSPPGVNPYLPTYRDERDLIVNLPTHNFGQDDITRSIALALAIRRRQYDTIKYNRISGSVAAAGAAISGAGVVVLHNSIVSSVGYGLLAFGLSGLAYANNRNEVPTPAGATLLAPPVTVEHPN